MSTTKSFQLALLFMKKATYQLCLQNLKDPALIKKHFSLVQSMLLADDYAKDSYLNSAATHLTRCILAAAV